MQTFAENELLSFKPNLPLHDLFGHGNEVNLRADMYHAGKEIFYQHPLHIGIHEFITNKVLHAKIDISNESRFPQRAAYLREEWFDRLIPELMNEIWIQGIAAVSFIKRSGIMHPIVNKDELGRYYNITIVRSKRTFLHKYRFYYRDKNSILRVDRTCMIFGNFGYDPDPISGALRSVVASLIRDERSFANQKTLADIAATNMARPMILTHTKRGAVGSFALENVTPPYYGGQDYVSEEQRRRITFAADQLDVMARHQQEFWDEYLQQIEDRTRGREFSAHQAYMNIIPLPPDHESASYQRADIRKDWREINEIFETNACLAYGIQRAHIISTPGKLQVSLTLADLVLIGLINRWRKYLSLILTKLMHRVFPDDETATIELLPDIKDTIENVHLKYMDGVLTWEGYKEYISILTGIDIKYLNKEEPPREQIVSVTHPPKERKEKKALF